jgi:hypothetical protein
MTEAILVLSLRTEELPVVTRTQFIELCVAAYEENNFGYITVIPSIFTGIAAYWLNSFSQY